MPGLLVFKRNAFALQGSTVKFGLRLAISRFNPRKSRRFSVPLKERTYKQRHLAEVRRFVSLRLNFSAGFTISGQKYIFVHGDNRRIFGRRGPESLSVIVTPQFVIIASASGRVIDASVVVASVENVADEILVAMGMNKVAFLS